MRYRQNQKKKKADSKTTIDDRQEMGRAEPENNCGRKRAREEPEGAYNDPDVCKGWVESKYAYSAKYLLERHRYKAEAARNVTNTVDQYPWNAIHQEESGAAAASACSAKPSEESVLIVDSEDDIIEVEYFTSKASANESEPETNQLGRKKSNIRAETHGVGANPTRSRDSEKDERADEIVLSDGSEDWDIAAVRMCPFTNGCARHQLLVAYRAYARFPNQDSTSPAASSPTTVWRTEREALLWGAGGIAECIKRVPSAAQERERRGGAGGGAGAEPSCGERRQQGWQGGEEPAGDGGALQGGGPGRGRGPGGAGGGTEAAAGAGVHGAPGGSAACPRRRHDPPPARRCGVCVCVHVCVHVCVCVSVCLCVHAGSG